MKIISKIAVNRMTADGYVFDHWATKEQTSLLKHEGDKVFGLKMYTGNYGGYGAYSNTPIIMWQELKNFEVVYGAEFETKEYKSKLPLALYEGDIFVDWCTGQKHIHSDEMIFSIWNIRLMDMLMHDDTCMIQVLNNVRQKYPNDPWRMTIVRELLRKQNETRTKPKIIHNY